MGNYKIKKGFDIELDGKPSCDLEVLADTGEVGVLPLEIHGVRWRLLVEEGDKVKRGDALLEDKQSTNFKLRAPASGTIGKITRGERRFVKSILIETDGNSEEVTFNKYNVPDIKKLSADKIISQLETTGYLAYLIQRPFSKMAETSQKPKSIFVNGMNTGPFQADASVVVEDDPKAFQAGIEILNKLTDGDVNLCLEKDTQGKITEIENTKIHTFSGVHPAGNTSVHISKIDPMAPTDIIWTIKAVDLVQIGKLFLTGSLPATKIVSLGGNVVVEDQAKHYKVPVGAPNSIFADKIESGDIRYICGDVLAGNKISKDDFIGMYQSSLTVIPESEERHFMGWAMPGITDYSYSRTFVSSIINFFFGRKLVADILGKDLCRLNTNTNGGLRAMVLTGYYDKVMPMNIMVDYLVRAVLAKDTDEAIQLGILETAPKDFALCDFICPSKMEIQEIIQKGLDMIEEEGI